MTGKPAAPSLTELLAEKIQSLGGRPPPTEVAERIVWTMIDNLGVAVHGSRLDEGRRFIAFMAERRGGPEAFILGTGERAPVERAAAAAAFVIHAAEIDDSDLRAQLRASAVVLPAVLGLAESLDVPGAEFVRAAALAYTVQGRLAAPMGAIQRFGWMSSGVWGPISAVAAASSLMTITREQAVSAMGLAGSSAGGAFQYYYDQTEEKRIVVARGARNAVESLLWAERGEGGPRRILEGQAGLYRLFGSAEAPAPEALFDRLEELEGPLFINPKFYAASHSIIPSLDGIALDLPADVGLQDVEAFVVRADEGWAHVLADKVDRFRPPETVLGAMLNYSFVVALFLARRSVMPRDYTPRTMTDAATLALAAKGRFEALPTPADLSIEFRLKDGRRFVAKARTPSRRSPLDEARRLAKFHALTALHLSDGARDRLIGLCRELPAAPSMRGWMRELAGVLTETP